MRRYHVIIILILLLTGNGVFSQDIISPADGMNITGSPAVITFRWEDDGSMYYLEVYAGANVIYSKPVSGGFFALNLPPNQYRWKLRKFYQGQYIEYMDFKTITISTEMSFDFSGRKGASGGYGSSGRAGESWSDGRYRDASPGMDGGPGQDGEDGGSVNVILQDAGDFVKVLITSGREIKDFYLARSSNPLCISANGGNGGDGGMGGSGGTVQRMSGAYGDPYATSSMRNGGRGGRGGDGGNGGNGGRGGTVTIKCPDESFRRYVRVTVNGGAGGRGGAGGPGGNPAGTTGSRGSEGKNGLPGEILYE